MKFFSDAGVAENCADPVSRRIRVKGPSLAPCPGSPIQQRHCVENAEVGGASPSRDTTTLRKEGASSRSRMPVLHTGGEGALPSAPTFFLQMRHWSKSKIPVCQAGLPSQISASQTAGPPKAVKPRSVTGMPHFFSMSKSGMIPPHASNVSTVNSGSVVAGFKSSIP